jgi:hypothetical protein
MKEIRRVVETVGASQAQGSRTGRHTTGGPAGATAPVATQCKVKPWQRQALTVPQRTPVLAGLFSADPQRVWQPEDAGADASQQLVFCLSGLLGLADGGGADGST